MVARLLDVPEEWLVVLLAWNRHSEAELYTVSILVEALPCISGFELGLEFYQPATVVTTMEVHPLRWRDIANGSALELSQPMSQDIK